MNQKKYYPTAVALYVTYFILGIAVTIMGQYKQSFAAMWGANQLADGSFDVSKVMAIIAAVGLGRLIAFPFAGPFSDKYGRRLSALVGVVFFAIFFIGITFTHSTVLAYILMICSGMANSFLDTSITPSCMEIFKENGAIANLFTKFAISMAQFLLPFLITFVAARDMSFRTLYFLAAGIIIVDGIFLATLPFPPKEEAPKAADGTVEKRKMKLTPSAILLVCIGFTASTTFMLFMNCNQELGKLYGMANPSMINSRTNELILAHCTVGLKQAERYIIRNHFETEKGIAIQGLLPTGDVTIVKCGGECLDEYYLSTGTLSENTNYINMCRTQVRIRMNTPAEYFLKNPLGNHHILIHGNFEDTLNEFFQANACKRTE